MHGHGDVRPEPGPSQHGPGPRLSGADAQPVGVGRQLSAGVGRVRSQFAAAGEEQAEGAGTLR